MKKTLSSASTSINATKVPAIFGKVKWEPGTKNLDYGGGKYDTATTYLASRGVENLIYDPYNRSVGWNNRVLAPQTRYDTCTISNVLNVIQDKDERRKALKKAMKHVKRSGTVYITIYEGDKSGVGRETKKDCWQNNQPLQFYAAEIREMFPDPAIRITVKNNMITLVRETKED